MINDQFITKLLTAINIVDVISFYLPLKKSGSNYKTRCPFHEEKSGSFLVSEPKQIYKCFGCGKSGNAITFIRDYEKVSFIDAVKKLAERANILIPDTYEKTKKNSKTELIYQVYELTNEFFRENLKNHGSMAKRYLSSRQLSEATIDKFNIGYSLDSFSSLKSYLQRNHINEKILSETGLFKIKENSIYDMFRDRLMFPIHSYNGKVVAFGGRALTAEQEKLGKYINSPTTDIYTKGKELYGLNITRYDISKKDMVLIVEGYMDFLRLYENGVTHVAASLGTSLTIEQIELLSRYTQNFYMLYDGDNAGKNAAIKGAGLIIGKGYNAKIVSLPDGHDPDTFLLNNPSSILYELIDKAETLSIFLKNRPEIMDSKKSLEFLTELSKDIQDPVFRELFIKEMSDAFQISEMSLLKKSGSINKKRVDRPKLIKMEKQSEERRLIQCILKKPEIIKKVAETIDISYFINDGYKKIYKTLTENDMINYLEKPADLLERIEDEEIKGILSSLYFEEDYDFDSDDLMIQIKIRKYQEDLNIINEEISKTPDNNELFEKKIFLKREIQHLSKHVVHKTLY